MARDRLLAALETSPRLSKREAHDMDTLVQEAREASLSDAARSLCGAAKPFVCGDASLGDWEAAIANSIVQDY